MHKLQEWFPTPDKKRHSHQYVHKHFNFLGTAQQRVDYNHLDFCLWGCLKRLMFSDPIENKATIRRSIFDGLSNYSQAPRIFWKDVSQWLEVSMLVLTQPEDTLNICCEVWLEKEWEHDGH
jgi:hypothetical protein